MVSELDPDMRQASTGRGQAEDAVGPGRWQFWSTGTLLIPQLARAILVVVFSSFCLIAFINTGYVTNSPALLTLSGACMLALLGLQLFYLSRPSTQLRSRWAYVALLAQAGLVYLPLLVFKQAWIGMPGFLAGSVLLVLPPQLAWPAFATVVASMAITQSVLSDAVIDLAYTTVSTLITGLVVYGLTRLANLVGELHAARNELAEMAVARERLRFARDLHDLLGYSLSAITLKSELTHRLMTKNPDKAQDELAEVLDISRKALADVRAVASGYRELSLDAEAESARSVLMAADVEVRMDLRYDELPSRVGTVLATVLREGITNVLRHSKAEHCDITVRQEPNGRVWLEIVNDGVQEALEERRSTRGGHGGSGIPNLSARVAALGGKLTTSLDEEGRFRLHAVAPITRGGAEPALTESA